jgi:hypothetical protein
VEQVNKRSSAVKRGGVVGDLSQHRFGFIASVFARKQ